MDISKYLRMKEKGTIQFQKVGDAAIYVVKKFDAETGDSLPPEVGPINLVEIERQRGLLKAQLNALDQFIADLKALI